MNWYRRNNKIKTLTVASIIVVLFVLGDFLTSGFLRGTVRSGVSVVITGTDTLVRGIKESNLFRRQSTLLREKAVLSNKLKEMQKITVRYSIARAENQALRKLLDVVDTRTAGVVVRIVSRPPASPFGTFLIGAGNDVGIREGDFVVGEGTVVFGKVVEAGSNTALVETIMRAGLESRVMVDGVETFMLGKSSSNASIILPRSVDVSVGTDVFLSENGLLVGIVGSINKTPSDAKQEILVHTPITISSTQFVRVIPSLNTK